MRPPSMRMPSGVAESTIETARPFERGILPISTPPDPSFLNRWRHPYVDFSGAAVEEPSASSVVVVAVKLVSTVKQVSNQLCQLSLGGYLRPVSRTYQVPAASKARLSPLWRSQTGSRTMAPDRIPWSRAGAGSFCARALRALRSEAVLLANTDSLEEETAGGRTCRRNWSHPLRLKRALRTGASRWTPQEGLS